MLVILFAKCLKKQSQILHANTEYFHFSPLITEFAIVPLEKFGNRSFRAITTLQRFEWYQRR